LNTIAFLYLASSNLKVSKN